MLIKKNLKTEQFVPCPIILKLKKQPFPFYPTYKKQGEDISNPSPLAHSPPKIEQRLLGSLPCRLKTKRLEQKEKKTLRFLYPINFFNFQRKREFFESLYTRTVISMLIHSRKESNNAFVFTPMLKNQGARVKAKTKKSQLKIVFKSYGSQVKDIEISIIAISKLTHHLNNFCVKQLKTFLTNSFYLPTFGFYPPFFNQPIKIKNSNNSNAFYQGVFSSFSLLNAYFKMRMPLLQKQQELLDLCPQMPLNLSLLIEQPLIELLEFLPNRLKTKDQEKDQSAFLLLILQKKNYCNRYFFKSSTCLDTKGPITKEVKKRLYNTQLFTVIRSPFVFKKTREQFILQKLSYSMTIELHNPIQKQFFIQCLSLLRLPVELEIHC